MPSTHRGPRGPAQAAGLVLVGLHQPCLGPARGSREALGVRAPLRSCCAREGPGSAPLSLGRRRRPCSLTSVPFPARSLSGPFWHRAQGAPQCGWCPGPTPPSAPPPGLPVRAPGAPAAPHAALEGPSGLRDSGLPLSSGRGPLLQCGSGGASTAAGSAVGRGGPGGAWGPPPQAWTPPRPGPQSPARHRPGATPPVVVGPPVPGQPGSSQA